MMGGKAFLVLVLFILLFLMLANSAMRNVDLTPRTPYVAPVQQAAAPGASVPQLALPQAGSGGTSYIYTTGGSGICASPYVVQCGDTLSSIARACGVTLQALLAVNPGIPNPNLIHPDDRVAIPGVAVVVPTAVPPTAIPPTAVPPTAAPTAGLPTIAPTVAPTAAPTATTAAYPYPAAAPAPVVSARPGDEIEMVVTDLPPNARVRYALGRVGTAPDELGEAVTDATGTLRVKVRLPLLVWGRQQWTITVTTIDEPLIQLTAVPVTVSY